MLLEINSPGGSDRLQLLNDRAASNRQPEDKGSDELILRPNQGMSTKRLEEFIDEIRHQPSWRRQADKEADYCDGNQLTAEQLQDLEDRGIAPIITNIMQPTINVVLGMEAKTRTDWMVREEHNEIDSELAQALSARLHKAEVGSRADRACSDAYAPQVKVGLGWVEVSKAGDPFEYPYRVRSIHRREIFWDWRSTEPDLSDARYLVRKRWLDEDTAVAAFPQYRELLRNVMDGWASWDIASELESGLALELARSLEIQRGFSVEQFEWLNVMRRRIAAYECWYRAVTRGHVLRLPDHRVVEFDLKNDEHVAAVYSGAITPQAAIFKKLRLAWWLGPHKVSDEPTPYKHNRFPYVPFWGFREDRTNVPFGLARPMISPQDEINARRMKMLWLLNSRRVIADKDAVLDHDKAASEVARPDAYIELNPARRPDSRFEVEDGGQLAAQQFQVLASAKEEINQVSGIFQSMMGQNSNASSGNAINSLIEQGSTTLAEINDNYRFARRLVGELLLALVIEDLEKQDNVEVMVGEPGEEKSVVLNQPATDEFGRPIRINDVSKVNTTVVLDDVPTSPTFRHQQMLLLTELTKSLPPEIQRFVIDMVIETMDLPKKRQVLRRIRSALGIGQDGQAPNPEVEELKVALQEAQAMLAEMQQDSQKRIEDAEHRAKKAELAVVNKEGELALRDREVDIKEIQVLGQQTATDEAAAGEAHAMRQQKQDQQDAINEEIDRRVRQAIAPLVEQLAKMTGGAPSPGALPQSDQRQVTGETVTPN